MIIKTLPLGAIEANTYILIDEESGSAAIIDAGDCNKKLLEALNDDRIRKIEYILLTHGHFDHIDGVPDIKKHFPDAKIAIHEADAPCLGDDSLSLARGFGRLFSKKVNADIILHDGDSLPFGNDEITVIHTPGHTKGGVTYKIGSSLFTGDTLFYLSIGRTDFPGGSYDVLNDSVMRLFDLEGEYTVYPGHDRTTSLDFERQHNRFVRWKNR